MERIAVSSSNVASIGYDPNTLILEVEFLNGSIYHYFGVPSDIYELIMSSPSKGTILNQYVKKAGYAFTRIQ